MMTRSCRKNGQLRLSPVHNFKRETASSPSVNKRLGEHIRDLQDLLVSCGDKGGILYKEKFNNSKPCILSEGQWFTPSEFEKFGGKEKNKKWKTSILYRQFPLQTLIEGGFLSSPSFKQKKIQDEESSPVGRDSLGQPQCKRALFTSSGSTRQVTISESSAGEEEEEEEEEKDTRPVHPSVFQTPTLPVSCGSVNGVLYKRRFASGSRSKSIRTEECWFTPEEFVKQELTMTDGHWKKDIQCHGKTLNYLLKKKILMAHCRLCSCNHCSTTEQDLLDEKNDDECFICNTECDLLCCDECPRAFHHQCHLPAVQDDSLGEKWSCTFCVLKINQRWWQSRHMTEEEALDSSISQLHCQYLLLCMYKEDIEHVFTEDPTKRISGYSRVIADPMWLDRVKTKLQNRKYRKLGQFVSDVRLIFHNCHMFNKGNKFDKLGSRLSEVFEREFKSIFNIQ
ncbi:nuclear body protein SP140-like isoform X2 [Colossoma macropomum]|uniref:nuclear body protein SP140-like isoform X2 n=1 Tax=Colossoma macropomum TaxID=42526 RepID=UPI0018645E24|nr:nuclear body protein SP140-like isoform X2 [Colossoma macropomum]